MKIIIMKIKDNVVNNIFYSFKINNLTSIINNNNILKKLS